MRTSWATTYHSPRVPRHQRRPPILPHVHDHPRFLRLLHQLPITPVDPPTDASWLNLIEARSGVTKRFSLTDTDDPDHRARQRRIVTYIRHRNRQAGVADHPLTRLPTIGDVKLEHRWSEGHCSGSRHKTGGYLSSDGDRRT